jgi:hypothetical protein
MTRTWLLALLTLGLTLAALAADGRYLLTLEKAGPDGSSPTLALSAADGVLTLDGGDAAALKLDGEALLRGKVTRGEDSYGLDCTVAARAVPGRTRAPSPARR